MDWYLPAGDAMALTELRHQVQAYLARHSLDGTGVDEALLTVQELVANGLEHAAGPVWVQLSWLEEQPTLTVRDLGPGFTLTDVELLAEQLVDEPAAPGRRGRPEDLWSEGGRGLLIVTHLASDLQAAVRPGGGTSVQVRLPVTRAASPSIDPPRRVRGALPDLAEAEPGGGFGREAFLRALVVQLANAVDASQGPGITEQIVAEVGAAVGGQMEEEYRLAEQVVGQMSPDQLAHCFVRLKHAIDGGFYLIEATPQRLVLGNTRCPFGEVVQRSPALCRMTSSVFGGIAARNSDEGAAVLLEERIAVGDPGCRVVVHLGVAPEAARAFAHRYTPPAAQPSTRTGRT